MKNAFFVLMILGSLMELFAQQNYEPGVILLQVWQPELVSFSDGYVINGSPQLQAILQQYPATGSRKLSHVNAETDGCYQIKYPIDFPLDTIRIALMKCPEIKYANLAYYGIFSDEPDDYWWELQWALQKIQMPNAWEVNKPNNAILIGIIDSGLDYTHEDLVDNIWTNPNEIAGNGIDDDGNGKIDDIHGWDFFNNPQDNDPQEEGTSHGTRVAGVIAARTYNGIGIAGIAGGWQGQVGIRLIGLRTGNTEGWTQSAVKEAIDYLTWLRQHYGYTIIANMSFQTTGIFDEPMPLLEASVNAAKNAGIIMVAAAGNKIPDPKSPYYSPGVATLPIPARYDGVLAVGASKDGSTFPNERRSFYSLYDNTEPYKLLVVAPVDTCFTSGINVSTTTPNNSYTNWFQGTSAASPMVAGVAALMLSINPELAWGDIANILAHTSDKIGNYPAEYDYTSYEPYGERNIEVGYGRLNTYQALLLTLCYSNKSQSSLATAYNNGRRLIKDDNNCYHLVYESGGEIFYRRSNPGGSSWEWSLHLSTGNGENKFPAISGTSENQFVVWQRYAGLNNGQHQYDTYFTEIYFPHAFTKKNPELSNLNFSTQQNPLPVISYKTRNGGYRLLICARRNNGIGFCYSDDYGVSWSPLANVPSTSSSHRNPSLSMGPTAPASTVYLTYDNGSNIYLSTYTTTWGSYELITYGTSYLNNKNASVEADNGNPVGKNVAWEAKKKTNNKYVILHKKNTTTNWNFTPKLFEPAGSEKYYQPSLTTHSAIQRSIVWHSDYGTVYRTYTNDNGSSWSTVGWADTYLQYPSLAAGSSSAEYVFTGGSTSPYQLYLSNETLPLSSLAKELTAADATTNPLLQMLPCPQHDHRFATIDDTASASLLWVQWGAIAIQGKNKDKSSVPFVNWKESRSELSQEQAFDYLSTAPVVIPDDADSLLWEYEFYGLQLEKLAATEAKEIIITVQLVTAESGFRLAELKQFQLPVTSKESLVAGKQAVAISGYRGKQVVLEVYPSGLALNKDGVINSAGDILMIENPFLKQGLPKQQPQSSRDQLSLVTLSLEQNYPNPFNPTTTISYQLSAGKDKYFVTLKIYDALGRLVKVLVEGQQAPGIHQISWDGTDASGRSVASGIYFYTIQAGDFRMTKKMVLMR